MSPVPKSSPRAAGPMARSLFTSFSVISLAGLLGLGLAAIWLRPALSGWFYAIAASIAVAVLAANAWLARRAAWPLSALNQTIKLFVDGNWEQRALSYRDDEIGQLANLFNRVADEIREVYDLLAIRDAEEQTNGKRQPLVTLIQIITAAPNLTELYRGALELILKHYACTYAALYIIEHTQPVGAQYAVLAGSAGSREGLPAEVSSRLAEERINLDTVLSADWMIGRAITSHRPQIGAANRQPGLFEAVIPALYPSPEGEPRLWAVIDLYSQSRVSDTRLGPFSVRLVNELLNLASLLALGVRNHSAAPTPVPPLAPTPTGGPLAAGDLISPALGSLAQGSAAPFFGEAFFGEACFTAWRTIAQAIDADQVVEAARQALLASPYVSVLLLRAFNQPHPSLEAVVGRSESADAAAELDTLTMAAPPLEIVFQTHPHETLLVEDIQRRLEEKPWRAESIFAGVEPSNGSAPLELLQAAAAVGAESAAFLPAYCREELAGILVIGRPARPALRGMQAPPLNPGLLEPYANLLQLVTAALERIHTQSQQRRATQRRLVELESLWEISQVMAEETQLPAFYPVLYQQVKKVLGELSSFAVLLYHKADNLVSVPYMIEDGKALQVAPFTPTKSLSSHIIHSRQALLLRNRQEVIETSLQIGALQVGQAAQSWLGVPMLSGGEVLGLVVVQDIRQEGRFDEGDQQLLSALANQAAIIVRNTQLLDASQGRIQQEQLINTITGRIRRSISVEDVLKTTADELGRALGLRQAHIEIVEMESSAPAMAEAAAPPSGEPSL